MGLARAPLLQSRTFRPTVVIVSALLSIILYVGLINQEFIEDRFNVVKTSKVDPKIFSKPGDAGIPKKIWYKLGPKGKSQEIMEWTGSCISQNPDYTYEFMTDASGDAWVADKFGATRPDVVEVYLNLSVPILKADMLRYLLLFKEGGIWSDLDVSCEGTPMDEWIPAAYRSNASLVVGWEFDWGLDERYLHQFASWTIMSKPGLRHMEQVIDDIVDAVYTAQVQNKVASIADITVPMVGDIVDFTGPRRLTRSVVASLERTLGRPIPRQEIENLRDPLMLDNVLILPGYAFSELANNFTDIGGPPGPVLLTHHYAGTWKNDYGGELA